MSTECVQCSKVSSIIGIFITFFCLLDMVIIPVINEGTFKEVQCKAPLICASGLSEITVSMAITAGASGVGVGSVINRLENEIEMIAMVKNLIEAINSRQKIFKQTF